MCEIVLEVPTSHMTLLRKINYVSSAWRCHPRVVRWTTMYEHVETASTYHTKS